MDAAYRLLLFDLDGTLLNRERGISRRNVETLHALMARGILVSFATGRSPRSAATIATLLRPNAALVLFNGALVRDMGTGEAIDRHLLPHAVALSALGVGAEMGLHANLYVDDDIFIAARTATSRASEAKDGVPHTVVGDLAAHLRTLGRDPIKILFIGDPSLFDPFSAAVATATGAGCEVVNSEPDYFEVLPHGVGKGPAMAALARHLKLSPEEVIAFGDNLNDTAMLRDAGLGVAMGNAHEALLATADVVIGDNDTDAIAAFLERELTIGEGAFLRRRTG